MVVPGDLTVVVYPLPLGLGRGVEVGRVDLSVAILVEQGGRRVAVLLDGAVGADP
jgi:hypothetical protein